MAEDHFQGPFDGADYDHDRDNERLTLQMKEVFEIMKDGVWRTPDEANALMKKPIPTTSMQAQFRNFRKPKHGFYDCPSRRREGANISEYRLNPVPGTCQEKPKPEPTPKEKLQRELRQVSNRLKELQALMKTEFWAEWPAEDRQLTATQEAGMKVYQDCLEQRIARLP